MKHIKSIVAGAAIAAAALAIPENSGACTRVVYHGADSIFVVGRSLDWKTPIPTNLYVYPAGMAKVVQMPRGQCHGPLNMVPSMPWGMTEASLKA